jgi:hypothetical protein
LGYRYGYFIFFRPKPISLSQQINVEHHHENGVAEPVHGIWSGAVMTRAERNNSLMGFADALQAVAVDVMDLSPAPTNKAAHQREAREVKALVTIRWTRRLLLHAIEGLEFRCKH